MNRRTRDRAVNTAITAGYAVLALVVAVMAAEHVATERQVAYCAQAYAAELTPPARPVWTGEACSGLSLDDKARAMARVQVARLIAKDPQP